MNSAELKKYVKLKNLLGAKFLIPQSTINKVGNGARLSEKEADEVVSGCMWLAEKLSKVTKRGLMK